MTKSALRKSRRSGNLPCSLCGEVLPLVEHHIHGRKVRGWSKSWNIVDVCPNCHDSIHLGRFLIAGWFKTTDGRKLIWHKEGEEPPEGFEGVRAISYGGETF